MITSGWWRCCGDEDSCQPLALSCQFFGAALRPPSLLAGIKIVILWAVEPIAGKHLAALWESLALQWNIVGVTG